MGQLADCFRFVILVPLVAVYVTGDPNLYNMSEVILTIYNVVVKGYHECPFFVKLGECFVAQKKKGDRGNALKVLDTTHGRRQLGHLQRDLVAPHWQLRKEIVV